jgi:hypothetical protein
MRRLLPLTLLLVSTVSAAHSAPAITLQLNPQVGYQPLTVEAQLRVEPNYLNIGTCITWFQTGAEFPDGKSCQITNEGRYLPRLTFYTIKALKAGDYDIVASVLRVRDFENTPTQHVKVLDRLY